MSLRDRIMVWITAIIVSLAYLILMLWWPNFAHAADNGKWADADAKVREWYRAQMINEPARQRLGVPFKPCCDGADVVRTQFRVGVNGNDAWEYLAADGWRVINPDIIHQDERAPNGQATLFVYHGLETCFYPPDAGG